MGEKLIEWKGRNLLVPSKMSTDGLSPMLSLGRPEKPLSLCAPGERPVANCPTGFEVKMEEGLTALQAQSMESPPSSLLRQHPEVTGGLHLAFSCHLCLFYWTFTFWLRFSSLLDPGTLPSAFNPFFLGLLG